MPSSNSKSNPYQRFIPSEEVQVVSAWQFTPMDGLHSGDQTAEETQAETVAEPTLDEVRQQAYAEGFEHGRLAGTKETRDQLEAPLKKQVQDQAQRLATLFQTTQSTLNTLEDHLADQVLALACDLARQVIRRELQQPLEPMKAVIQEAVALAVEDHSPATLKLNPIDLAMVQSELAEPLQEQRVKLVADPKLSVGSCVVEAVHGAVDATMEKRWSRAVANLGLNLPWDTNGDAHD